jgi:hypothetical protein
VHGRPLGITATAVSSLSMEPPSLLACINRAGDGSRLDDRPRQFPRQHPAPRPGAESPACSPTALTRRNGSRPDGS